MFTGLIADLGEVSRYERRDGGARIAVRTVLAGELSEGDSIALNGVCLTATGVSPGEFEAQAIAETLRRSSLCALQEGSRVNLELPLRLGDRLGGHIVQGHVDGVGTVAAARKEGSSRVLTIELPGELAKHVVLKGSIALDGVSLTVSDLADERLSVSLIPETLQRTTLGTLQLGEQVNVEVDVLAKHVERLLGTRPPSTLTGR
jgi:riboflavin synthase